MSGLSPLMSFSEWLIHSLKLVKGDKPLTEAHGLPPSVSGLSPLKGDKPLIEAGGLPPSSV